MNCRRWTIALLLAFAAGCSGNQEPIRATKAAAPGEPSHLPHFTNVAMGESLRKIARAWPRKKFLVICGHTHERFSWQAEENLIVKVAGARYGDPAVEEVLEF